MTRNKSSLITAFLFSYALFHNNFMFATCTNWQRICYQILAKFTGVHTKLSCILLAVTQAILTYGLFFQPLFWLTIRQTLRFKIYFSCTKNGGFFYSWQLRKKLQFWCSLSKNCGPSFFVTTLVQNDEI